MNSLESYKNQCYNIGSPSPDPIKVPLASLSKSVASEFSFPAPNTSPKTSKPRTKINCKLPTPTSRKRGSSSLDPSPTISASKKSKMMSPEELRERFDLQRKENHEILEKMTSRMDSLFTKLDTITQNNIDSNNAVQDTVNTMQDQVRGLQTSVDDNRVKFESKLVELEGQFNKFQENALNSMVTAKEDIKEVVRPMIEEITPKIKDEVKKELLAPIQATWNTMQAEKVHEHDHSLIIFGLEVAGNTIEAAGKFLRDVLKVSDETLLKISIKEAFKLGKGDGKKVPPFLVKFGHPSERNTILSHSKNLAGSNIKIEKHVPKNYQEKYKEFKKMSWKLKTMPEMDYMTQIIFDAHQLVLRFKKKDIAGEKYHWTIHSTFVPAMDSKGEMSTLKVPPGTKPTPPPDSSASSKANAALFMTIKGMKEKQTNDTIKKKLDEYLDDDDKDLIDDVKVTNRADLIILYCKTWATAKKISTSYNKKFNDCDVAFELFAQEEPGQQHV